MKIDQRVAVITGANRGMGFETARQLSALGLEVVLTSRRLPEAQRACSVLGAGHAFQLDVTSSIDAESLGRWLESTFGRCDVLINNAGAFFEPTDQSAVHSTSVLNTPLDTYIDSFSTNALGALIVSRNVVPVMRRNGYGRIVNVSSAMGSLSTMTRGWPAYRISKAALNAVTRLFADELRAENIKVNAVNPGWVRTDMGGAHAALSVAQGVLPAIRAATLPDDGPTGEFLEEGGNCPW